MPALHDLVPFVQGGPFLALLGYMAWDKLQQRAADQERANVQREIDRDRIETDRRLAGTLAVLAERIGASRHV
jgi:hypothetical protein